MEQRMAYGRATAGGASLMDFYNNFWHRTAGNMVLTAVFVTLYYGLVWVTGIDTNPIFLFVYAVVFNELLHRFLGDGGS